MLVYFYFAGDGYLFSSIGDTPFHILETIKSGLGCNGNELSNYFLERSVFHYISVPGLEACGFGVVPFGILFRCWSLDRGPVLWRENRR